MPARRRRGEAFAPAAHAQASSVAGSSHAGTATFMRSISPRAPKPAVHARTQRTLPLLRPTTAASGRGGVPATQTLGGIAPRYTSTHQLQVLQSFQGVTGTENTATYGDVAPPDVSFGVGPGHVVETVNGTVRFMDRTGGILDEWDVDSWFGTPSGYAFTDPTTRYDQLSGRWFMTGLMYPSATADSSVVVLLASQTSNPMGNWDEWAIAQSDTVLHDQPRLGWSSDKILVSTEDFAGGQTFSGVTVVVVNKADVTGFSASPRLVEQTLDQTWYGAAPAVETTSQAMAFLSQPDAATDELRVGAYQGVPGGTVTRTDYPVALTAGALADPPSATQPSGTAIDANDARAAEVTWRGNQLWTALGQSCTPAGDTVARACVRYVHVDTSAMPGAGDTLVSDTVVGLNAHDVYFPTVGVDYQGAVYTSFTESGPTMYPSLAVAGFKSTSLTTMTTPLVVASGGTSYNSIADRWGDYATAALDPVAGDDMWVSGEYVDNSSAGTENWSTGVARVSFAPTAVSIGRSASTVTYGTRVTLSTKALRPGGAGLPGAHVTFYARPHGTSYGWLPVGSVQTNSAGAGSLACAPGRNMDFLARLQATSTAPAANSGVTTVAVATKVALAESRTKLALGGTVTLAGWVAPNHAGQVIYLQRHYGGGWHSVASKKLSSSSSYTWVIKPATKGAYYYRTYKPADVDHAAAVSTTKAFSVV